MDIDCCLDVAHHTWILRLFFDESEYCHGLDLAVSVDSVSK